MSGRERLLRVLRQEPVDRIPVSPFIHVNYVKEFFGTHDVDCVVKTPDVYRHFGFDVIHRNCSVPYDAYGPAADNWKIETEVVRQGRDETTSTTITTPQGQVAVKEALRWVYEYDAEVSATEFPIRSEADLGLFVRYQPAPEPAVTSDIRRAKESLGDGGVIAPWIQGAFNLVAIYYRKLDDLLVDAVVAPHFYAGMMEYFLSRYMGFVQGLIDAGADVLSYGANVANAKLIGPEFYREHIWPYEKRLIDFIQNQGVIVLFHNCGYARNFFPLYSQLGMRAYESLTPTPYGDTDLAEAVRAFGTATTLAGGVDQLDLLRKGSAAEIVSTVKAICQTVRNRCHFILGTTDYFNEATPRASIHTLAEAGRRYGSL
jgi:uroporphyrinogen-III decarboxylase